MNTSPALLGHGDIPDDIREIAWQTWQQAYVMSLHEDQVVVLGRAILADRGGYTPSDTALVSRALAMANETHRVMDAWELISPVAVKVWGDGSNTVQRLYREEGRLDRFEHVLGIVEQTCASAAQMDIPYITAAAAKTAIKEIRAARQNLQILLTRIEEVHS